MTPTLWPTLGLALALAAAAHAETLVLAVRNPAWYELNGGTRPLAVFKFIPNTASVATGPGGQVKLYLASRQVCVIGPESRLSLPGADGVARLTGGRARFRLPRVPAAPGRGGEKFRVLTPNAVAAVRGTDYFVSYLGLLGETEIVNFDGTVRFQNRAKPKDERVVPKGHWGGLGGRFGGTIAPLINLPANVLSAFSRGLTMETDPGAAPPGMKFSPQPGLYGELTPSE